MRNRERNRSGPAGVSGETPRRTRRAVLAAAVTALALCGPCLAQAPSALAGVPHWLKAPYVHYTLTYTATESAQGSILSSTPTPPEGVSACELPVNSDQGSLSLRTVITYSLVFGRYHPPSGATRLAFVYQGGPRSTTGQAQIALHQGAPTGCAPGSRVPEDASCSQQIGEDEAPMIEFGSNPTSTRFGLALSPQLHLVGEPACSGSSRLSSDVSPAGFDLADGSSGPPMPSNGTMQFTASGIRASRTFRGKVNAFPEAPTNTRQGTETTPTEQTTWTFGYNFNASLVLAPTKRHG